VQYEVDRQLTLHQALALGHIVELEGAVAELRDQVGLQFPLDVVELVDEDVVDVKTGLGAREVALEAVVGREVLGIDLLGYELRQEVILAYT
jgi:hypothetical protein